jgi:hypothetical protein
MYLICQPMLTNHQLIHTRRDELVHNGGVAKSHSLVQASLAQTINGVPLDGGAAQKQRNGVLPPTRRRL